jgi:TIR domain
MGDAESESGAGTIRLRAWGENAESLIDPMLEALQKLPVGQPPEIKRIIEGKVAISSYAMVESGASRLDNLEIAAHPELPSKGKPEIFVSYSWGDDSSEDAWKRAEVVDRLCETLDKDGWHILRDSNVLRSGELISGFMKRIGLADHVIVVLSDKYLRSPYCMTELHSHLSAIAWREGGLFAPHYSVSARRRTVRHLAQSSRLYQALESGVRGDYPRVAEPWVQRISDSIEICKSGTRTWAKYSPT